MGFGRISIKPNWDRFQSDLGLDRDEVQAPIKHQFQAPAQETSHPTTNTAVLDHDKNRTK